MWEVSRSQLPAFGTRNEKSKGGRTLGHSARGITQMLNVAAILRRRHVRSRIRLSDIPPQYDRSIILNVKHNEYSNVLCKNIAYFIINIHLHQ